MKKLYCKSRLAFALAWIGIYLLGSSVTEALSRVIGLEKSLSAAFHLLCAVFILSFLKKQGAFSEYGLCPPSFGAKHFLWYLPLLLAGSCNLWFGLRTNYSPTVTILYLISMLCVGFLEEIIFRGFLFKAMSADNIKSAIIVSSLSFGIGHILNLFNGSGMELVSNLCQVLYAIAFGFLFVVIFHRGGSLIPCIIAHSGINMLSAFSAEPATVTGEIASAGALALIGVLYTLILLKTLPGREKMTDRLRQDAEAIALSAIDAVRPDEAVKRALENVTLSDSVYLVAVGKAAWQMAQAAVKYLPRAPKDGIVLTKYGHVMGEIENVRCYEAGHPVPDENGFAATEEVIKLCSGLTEQDTVLFLLSGGGSALFEKPLVPGEQLQEITSLLLSGGADIVEINTVRKRLSAVKGGKFAKLCAPARIEAVILSDVLGDPVDMIASGPAAADSTSCAQALEIAERYGLLISPQVECCLRQETEKSCPNVNTQIIGSVKALCTAAAKAAEERGYGPVMLTDTLDCEASDAGRWLASLLKERRGESKKLALIAGGETVVHLKGEGLGGRNQELALASAEILSQLDKAAVISVGSDGTDGPTDAAGGYVDSDTLRRFHELGLDYHAFLQNNDSYHALKAVDGLIITGPTGTNVNDVAIGLLG